MRDPRHLASPQTPGGGATSLLTVKQTEGSGGGLWNPFRSFLQCLTIPLLKIVRTHFFHRIQ